MEGALRWECSKGTREKHFAGEEMALGVEKKRSPILSVGRWILTMF